MTTNDKIPLRQAEVSVRRFNDMAIPHHLGLLQNHRSNIEKSLALGDWNKIRKEEINAARVIKQMKNLLMEMDTLRAKVQPQDLVRFDAMMDVGKQKAFAGMREYLELQLKSPTSTVHSQLNYDEAADDDPYGQPVAIGSTMAHQDTLPQLQTDFHLEEHQLAQRQACLDELEHLQHEILELNGLYHDMRVLVQDQAPAVQAVADNAEEALENVQAGEQQLRRALTYKKAMYPVVGALIGTCVGGPIGLVAGLKAGGLAAVGCGILGFTGGSVLKSNPAVVTQGNIDEEQLQTDGDDDDNDDTANSATTDNIEMERQTGRSE